MANGENHTDRHTTPQGIRGAIKTAVSIALALLLFGGMPCGRPAYGQPAVSDEYLVKSAFLFNFTKFVKWPQNAYSGDRAPLVFCVLGKDPFGSYLDLLEGKSVKGRPIVIRRAEDLSKIEPCQVLYVSVSKRSELKQILSRVKGHPILTVSDIPGFTRRGGIIGLYKFHSKIRFAINPRAAAENGLKVSSQLMKLSHTCGSE